MSRVHQRYRRQTDRQTDRQTTDSVVAVFLEVTPLWSYVVVDCAPCAVLCEVCGPLRSFAVFSITLVELTCVRDLDTQRSSK